MPEESTATAVVKRTRRTKADVEKGWYDCFEKWDKQDREVALRVLQRLHERLPDMPRKPQTESDQEAGE